MVSRGNCFARAILCCHHGSLDLSDSSQHVVGQVFRGLLYKEVLRKDMLIYCIFVELIVLTKVTCRYSSNCQRILAVNCTR